MAKSKIPKPLSPGEEEFALHCRIYSLTPVREFIFDKVRKWRFDFCWPDIKVAVEIEGGTFSNGGHVRGKGYAENCLKYNAANLQGWHVYRFTTEHVHSGYAIDTICEAINGTKNLHGNASQSKEVSTAKQ